MANQKNARDDDDDYSDSETPIVSQRELVSRVIDIYLDDDIGKVSNYRKVIGTLRNSGVDDSINIWIDTDGGYCETATAIMDAMEISKANITCIIQGKAYSAGSMIALAAPAVYLCKNASMMIHHVSYGTSGKQHEIQGYTAFMQKTHEELARRTYKDFLSDKEISEVIAGKDIWLTHDEIALRLSKREKLRKKQRDTAKE